MNLLVIKYLKYKEENTGVSIGRTEVAQLNIHLLMQKRFCACFC